MRLRDQNEDWGLSPIENLQRDRRRYQDMMKKRAKRERLKLAPPPMICEQPVDNAHRYQRAFQLKAQDIQELGIFAVRNKLTNISLPFVSLIHGKIR